jgi:hypothetical protein
LIFSPKYLRGVTNYENLKIKGGETHSTHLVKSDVQTECVAGERTEWDRRESC